MKVHLLHTTKFWNIRVGMDEFVVQYGKCGTVGKAQLKSFDTAEACKKEADKLVRQKLKKGYVEVEYDWDTHLYVDDAEVGPDRLTAHPRFNAHFQDDFYLDCTDEFAPFGSDEGADVLVMFEDAIRKERDIDFLVGAYEIVSDWMERDVSTPDDWATFKYGFECDVVVMSSAFASIKLTGHLETALQEEGIAALDRLTHQVELEDRPRFESMKVRLNSFPTSS
ncbi:WGR domain-containing protein [Exiguobacterium alkaliphilum]|uniref:WGR domain-containing protein n=1 Tax=Exiguobacterium alkaliphilum TaxID=1428684 RepID=A0ABT2KWH5_9BACL|nr:WGR domain-containing protein [Exiguobacterium alkaliphilum]MCT4795282.1 WGR domain-containing protein [Exiguobacterium alkaliphilum]